jgi:uncharacterized membrane protein HdeD (DUF308 family)
MSTLPTIMPQTIFKRATGWGIALSILLIVLGTLAIALPLIAAIAVTSVVAWLMIFGGLTHLSVAFSSRGASLFWELLVAIAYVFTGGYMVFHPVIGVATLTLLLASFFLVEGVLEIAAFFQVRGHGGAGWMLLDGIITLALAGLIWVHWPSSAAWAIGIIVGVSMLVSGWKWLMISLISRKALTLTAGESAPDRLDSAA